MTSHPGRQRSDESEKDRAQFAERAHLFTEYLPYAVVFGVVCVLLETYMSYARYAAVLKWATLCLFAYVAVVFAAHVPWGTALAGTLVPHLVFDKPHAMAMVAVLGTTISPYLFFWQAGQEVEELRRRHVKALCITPRGLAGLRFARERPTVRKDAAMPPASAAAE